MSTPNSLHVCIKKITERSILISARYLRPEGGIMWRSYRAHLFGPRKKTLPRAYRRAVNRAKRHADNHAPIQGILPLSSI